MPTRYIAALAIALVTIPIPGLDAQGKKYDVRSGVITYETMTLERGGHVAGRVILYFDQFGRKECKDTYKNGMLKESVLFDGRTLYTIWHDQRIVFKNGPSKRGTELRFDWEALPSSEKAEGLIKRLPAMKCAGKVCEAFERTTSGGVIRYAGADHILLYCERNLKRENWVMKAVSFDDTTAVPAWKFAPPAGYVERKTHF